MKEYFKRFVKEEDGADLLEFVIIIAIVAAIALVVYGIVDIVKKKMDEAQKAIEGIQIPGSTPGGGTP